MSGSGNDWMYISRGEMLGAESPQRPVIFPQGAGFFWMLLLKCTIYFFLLTFYFTHLFSFLPFPLYWSVNFCSFISSVAFSPFVLPFVWIYASVPLVQIICTKCNRARNYSKSRSILRKNTPAHPFPTIFGVSDIFVLKIVPNNAYYR